MDCDVCGRANAEGVGVMCGEYRACVICISSLVADAVLTKDTN